MNFCIFNILDQLICWQGGAKLEVGQGIGGIFGVNGIKVGHPLFWRILFKRMVCDHKRASKYPSEFSFPEFQHKIAQNWNLNFSSIITNSLQTQHWLCYMPGKRLFLYLFTLQQIMPTLCYGCHSSFPKLRAFNDFSLQNCAIHIFKNLPTWMQASTLTNSYNQLGG